MSLHVGFTKAYADNYDRVFGKKPGRQPNGVAYCADCGEPIDHPPTTLGLLLTNCADCSAASGFRKWKAGKR